MVLASRVNMHISVIIPSRNRNAQLLSLIRALSAQQLSSDISCEAIIALDGSVANHDLRTAAGKAPFSAQILELPHGGISFAKNEALRVARGEILVLLNDDVQPQPDFLMQHAKAQMKSHLTCAILGWTDWQTYPDTTIMDALIRETRMIFFYGDMEEGVSYSYRYAWNLNLSVPRSLVEKAGFFREAFRPCMYEDIELAWRLAKLNCPVIYHPNACALHDHRYTWESYLRREIMLGMMAPVLSKVNPECFYNIFEHSLNEVVQTAGLALAVDTRDDRRIYETLARELTNPYPVHAPKGLLSALYLAHLSVKRRAFRIGLLHGIRIAERSWQKREVLSARIRMPEDLFSESAQTVIPV